MSPPLFRRLTERRKTSTHLPDASFPLLHPAETSTVAVNTAVDSAATATNIAEVAATTSGGSLFVSTRLWKVNNLESQQPAKPRSFSSFLAQPSRPPPLPLPPSPMLPPPPLVRSFYISRSPQDEGKADRRRFLPFLPPPPSFLFRFAAVDDTATCGPATVTVTVQPTAAATTGHFLSARSRLPLALLSLTSFRPLVRFRFARRHLRTRHRHCHRQHCS